jgi:DNA-directed RNA polymerase alpha subunit
VRGLKQGGLQTAGEIAAYTADELKVLCNLGNKSARELAEELPALGIPFSASE